MKFYKLPAEIASRRDLPAGAKIIMAVIVDRIGENSFCWPGCRTLAEDTGLSVPAVLDSIQRLEDKGILQVKRQGSGKANRYYINLQSAQESLAPKNPKRSRKFNSGAQESLAQALKKVAHNQRDTLNQTVESTSFAFVLKNKKLWYLPKEKLDEYTKTFSNLDVETEFRKAVQWLIDNPCRRKKAEGMTRFLGGWLGRVKPKPEPKRGDPDWLPTEEEAEEIFREDGIVK